MIKKTALTISLNNQGHGSFPRQKKMAEALSKRGYKVYWICPKKISHSSNIKHVKLLFNFIPNFLFLGLFVKLFLTSLFNYKIFKSIERSFVLREYDGLALFFNPFLNNSKNFFFSRGDVISILKINLPDQKLIKKLIHILVIKVYPVFQKILLLKTNVLIFQQTFLKNIFIKRIGKISKAIHILSNDCPNSVITTKQIIKKSDQKKKYFTIGFATPMYWSCKGLENIQKIINFEKNKKYNYIFLVAGDGPHLNMLKKKINQNSRDSVRWLGWEKNIYKFLEKIDLLIIPSNFDSNPNMILEAISFNKLLLATNIKAHKEILKNKIFLFNKRNINDLYKKIDKIQKNYHYKFKFQSELKKIKTYLSFDWGRHFYNIIKAC